MTANVIVSGSGLPPRPSASVAPATISTRRPARTLVCGDIYEMDLAMPQTLGAAVHLVVRPSTRAWERDAAQAFGTASSSLLDALAHGAFRRHRERLIGEIPIEIVP